MEIDCKPDLFWIRLLGGALKTGSHKQSRPRLAGERLDELLDAAAEVFIEDGFQGASTNVIAQKAGASKASLYARFAAKEDLFLAVLERRMNQTFQSVSSAIVWTMPLREALTTFAAQMLQIVFSDKQIALIRVVSMETARFPELGQRFFELGPERGITVLSTYLQMQMEAGALRSGNDPQIIAQQFLGMIGGPALLFRLLGITSRLKTKAQQMEHIRNVVDAFLRAYGA